MRRRSGQRGAALLAMLAVLVLGGAWWIVSGRTSPTNRVALQREQNGPVLQQAKQALLAWAAMQAASTSDLNPGHLPCPEDASLIGTATEGTALATCPLPAVGRLPWRTLGLDKLRDASGEPLWYVVSSGWAIPNNTTPTLGLNSNSLGNLTVDGVANSAAAMIIAPGAPIMVAPNANQVAAGCAARTQVRTPAAPNYLDYLECQSVAASSLRTNVVDNSANVVFNDQALAVSAADVMTAVEPVVALRIQRDVIPNVMNVYNSAPANCSSFTGTLTNEWGVSFTCPAGTTTKYIFPFAAPFSTASAAPCAPLATDVSNLGAASFKGAGCTQGLLPVSSTTCNTMTNGPCDSTFVQWDTTTVSLNPSSGTNWTSTCTPSTASQIRCDITFNKTCTSGVNTATCAAVVPGAAVLAAQATNVGNAMRTLSTTSIANFGTPTMTAPIAANAVSSAAINGTLPSSGTCTTTTLFFTLFYYCTISSTVSITVPISVFADHPFLAASGPTPASTGTAAAAWFWFLANKWHQVTYYAVAPLHAPGGAGGCSGATCISVTVAGGSTLSDRRAVLALAGHSITGTSGASRTFADFLDSAENRNLDLAFQQDRSGKTFNDRFVSLSP